MNTALESLAFQTLDEHVRPCVAGALSSGDEQDAQMKTEELLESREGDGGRQVKKKAGSNPPAGP